MKSFALLVALLSASLVRADFVLSDGTIIVTGRNSAPSFVRTPEFSRVVAVVPPTPTSVSDEELVWNKWDAGNFVVLSLDKSDGQRIRGGIEDLREALLSDLGVRTPQSTICKIVCVPDSTTLKKFFGLDSSHAETKRDSSGNVISSAIWINMEDKDSLPRLLLSVCLEDAFPSSRWFAVRGAALLGDGPSALKNIISETPSLTIKSLSEVTKEKWSKMEVKDRLGFDRSAASALLLVRREFGRDATARFLGDQSHSSLGFGTSEEMEGSFRRYCENLSKDIRDGRTPDNYLRVTGR